MERSAIWRPNDSQVLTLVRIRTWTLHHRHRDPESVSHRASLSLFVVSFASESLPLIARAPNVFLNLSFLLIAHLFFFFSFAEKTWKFKQKKDENFLFARRKIFNNFFICLIIRVRLLTRSWSTEHRHLNRRRRRDEKSVHCGRAQEAKVRLWHLALLFQERWCKSAGVV